jgi:hypothetical protein
MPVQSKPDRGAEIKRPTLEPHTFTRWSKEYIVEAMREFGDAGKALKKEKHFL